MFPWRATHYKSRGSTPSAVRFDSESLQYGHILVTTATIDGSVLFSSRCTFQHRDRIILAKFGYFVANLRISLCAFTGLDNGVVHQN